MEIHTEETTKMENLMDMDNIFGLVVHNTKVNLQMDFEKAKELGLVSMEISMWGILAVIGKMDMANIYGLMGIIIKANFAKI